MTDEQCREILETIIELAATLGWVAALAQAKDGQMMGMYIGPEDWIKIKTGATSNQTH